MIRADGAAINVHAHAEVSVSGQAEDLIGARLEPRLSWRRQRLFKHKLGRGGDQRESEPLEHTPRGMVGGLDLRKQKVISSSREALDRSGEHRPSQAQATAQSGNGADPTPEAGPLAFEIRAPFASLDAQGQLALLQQLGSEGMARRLNLLRSEGLMP
jgi:hypothetical protein